MSENVNNFDELRALKELEHEYRLEEIQAKGEEDRKTEEVKKQNAIEQERLRALYEKQQQRDRFRNDMLLSFSRWAIWLVGTCVVTVTDLPEKLADKAHRESKG